MTRSDLVVLSPAKINRFLHITGRRQDGYHELQTLFQFLDIGDEMVFSRRADGLIERIDEHQFTLPENDLCIRAALGLRELAGRHGRRTGTAGYTIVLRKRIPPGSGLGAGSSNAATTLLVLNQLWQLNLPLDTLMPLALELGADVPIFVYGKSAWAEGVGDRLIDCSPETGPIAVIVPPVNVPTARLFSNPFLTRNHPAVDIADYNKGKCGNDLEALTFNQYPEVKQAWKLLSRYGNARMSGTGSAVFVTTQDTQSAQQAIRDLPPGFLGFSTRIRNSNPVVEALAGQSV